MVSESVVTVATAAERDPWERYVGSYVRATHYHQFGWGELIRQVFGHQVPYFIARNAGVVTGVLPTVRLKSRLFGDYLVSMPYFNYGGVLANDNVTAGRLLDAAADYAAAAGLDHFEVRHTDPMRPTWPARADKVCMHLPLPDDEETLFKNLGSKLRAQIRRPEKEGACARDGGAELLDDFYTVFSRNMRDLGTPVYGRRFFSAMLAAWPQDTRIMVVHLGEVPVAAAFLIGYRERLEIPWASSLREYNRYGVNMMLYAEVLKYAIRNGYQVFDFGRSTVDAGTYKFKKQWGAQPQPLHWEYWLPDGAALPELRPDSPKFRLAVSAWQRLPVRLANWIGPSIVKNLP